MDTPSIALVLLHPPSNAIVSLTSVSASVAFMAMVNHLVTTVAHCQLITGGRTRKKDTFISRRAASVTKKLGCMTVRCLENGWVKAHS